MSQLASDYYQERADRLGVVDVPAILSGEPWALLEGSRDCDYLSLQRPDPDLLNTATNHYRESLESVSTFLTQCAVGQLGENKTKRYSRLETSNMLHIKGMIEGRLFPSWLKAGRLYDIQIEAIARSEVETPMLNRAAESNCEAREEETEERSVYFATSAMLYAGRPLGQVACLTVAYINRHNLVGLTPHYLGAAFRRNDLIAKSGLWQSRATRNCIDAWGIDSAVVQPVRRGKSDRKRGAGHH